MSSDSGEQEPIAKKKKTYDADGPIEDDKTARVTPSSFASASLPMPTAAMCCPLITFR